MGIIKTFLAKKMVESGKKKSPLPIEILETRHSNPEVENFNDSSYFNGRSYDGSSFVTRMAFRNSGKNEWWLKFHLPSKGRFHLADLKGAYGEQFQQGNLQFKCEALGQKWKVLFHGMLQDDQGHSRKAKIDLTFEAVNRVADFKQIKPANIIHQSIAEQPWNKAFFSKLNEISKQHYEQAGYLKGTIEIDGELTEVDWYSIRDHSFGVRKWGNWKRHIWIGGLLDDKRAFNISGISYNFLGDLQAGFLQTGDETVALKSCSSMAEISSKELIPRNFTVPFTLHNGTTKTMHVKIIDRFLFEMEDDYQIFEGLSEYTLDGVTGLGVSEFGFNPKFYPNIKQVIGQSL